MGHNSPPTPTLPHKGGGRNKAPSPKRGEGETRLPPPLWGRVGVGGKGKNVQSPRAQYNITRRIVVYLRTAGLHISNRRDKKMRPPIRLAVMLARSTAPAAMSRQGAA